MVASEMFGSPCRVQVEGRRDWRRLWLRRHRTVFRGVVVAAQRDHTGTTLEIRDMGWLLSLREALRD